MSSLGSSWRTVDETMPDRCQWQLKTAHSRDDLLKRRACQNADALQGVSTSGAVSLRLRPSRSTRAPQRFAPLGVPEVPSTALSSLNPKQIMHRDHDLLAKAADA